MSTILPTGFGWRWCWGNLLRISWAVGYGPKLPDTVGFRIGKADFTLFTRKMGKNLFVYQIYIDDIIFGSTNKFFYDEFSKIMIDMFEMSMMGELKYFLDF
jgi:hypothetical protein